MNLNPQDLVVPFNPTQARAVLGVNELKHVFSMNPDEVKWSYKNNTVTRDTIGGRVVQILSATTEAMTVTGRAGSRKELQVLSANLKKIMQYQIKTGDPVNFKVPSRNWHFLVYVQNVSNLGWDVSTTSYPYQLILMIKDDLTGVYENNITNIAFDKLSKGIGYNGKFHGGDVESARKYAEAIVNAVGAIDYSRDGTSGALLGDENGPTNGATSTMSPYCSVFFKEVVNGAYIDLKRPGGGVFDCRKILNSSSWSDHAWGAAIDVGKDESQAQRMQQFANFAVQNASKYHISYVIYNYRIWTKEQGWHNYTGANHHTNHVHVSFTDAGTGTPPCAK